MFEYQKCTFRQKQTMKQHKTEWFLGSNNDSEKFMCVSSIVLWPDRFLSNMPVQSAPWSWSNIFFSTTSDSGYPNPLTLI